MDINPSRIAGFLQAIGDALCQLRITMRRIGQRVELARKPEKS